MMREDIIDDVLAPGLRVVFCGTQPGAQSAARRAYYAGRGNRFWPTLHRIGLTPVRLQPEDFRAVLHYGIGLTDLGKRTSGPDSAIEPGHIDVARLRASLRHYRPAVLAFNSKRAAAYALARPTGQLAYGMQTDRFEGSRVFILPSTSGLASGLWDIRHWQDLADCLGARDLGENAIRETSDAAP
jgi:double-stranded uracil-DNA glycosylase